MPTLRFWAFQVQTLVPNWCQIHPAQPVSHYIPLKAPKHSSSRAVVQHAMSLSILAVGRFQGIARCNWTPQAAGCPASAPKTQRDRTDGMNHPSGRPTRLEMALQLVRILCCWCCCEYLICVSGAKMKMKSCHSSRYTGSVPCSQAECSFLVQLLPTLVLSIIT